MKWLMYKDNIKVQGNDKIVANYERLECYNWESGMDHCQLDKIKTTNKNSMKDKEINKYHILSINMVYADNYILRAQGRLYCTKVK